VAARAPLGSILLATALIVGVAYYVGAWVGFTTLQASSVFEISSSV
jgi:hypothetical protein